MSMSSSAREARLQYHDYDKEISIKSYNTIMGGTVLYGLIMNAIICTFFQEQILQLNFLYVIIGYFVCAIIGICMSRFSHNPVISFISYNFLVIPVGVLLTPTIAVYAKLEPSVITQAFLLTAIITSLMIFAAIVKPDFFAKIGGILFVCLLGLVIGGIVMMLLRIDSIIYSYISAAIFSLYIGYDFYRSQQFPKTVDNAVDCAMDIYLDIINLFLDLLRILSKRK